MASTIKDVAVLCGVSVATISNVITGKKYVSPEVTEKVLEAMRRLDYQPNLIARSLKSRKTTNIGIIVPDIRNPFFADIVTGAESRSKEMGYQIFLCSTQGDIPSEEKALNSFISQNVAGIINVAPRLADKDLLAYGNDAVPMVVVDRPIDVAGSKTLGCVCADNATGCRQLAAHFIEMGHKRFACFTGPQETVPNAKTRLNSFCDHLFQSGFAKSDIVICQGEFTFESGFYLMDKLLEKKDPPTAVFVASDLMAWGALECAKKHGVAIPARIAIAGYDNVYISSFVSPALTTVDHPKYEAGVLAFTMLMDILSSGKDVTRAINLNSALVVRGSTLRGFSRVRTA